MSHGCALAEDSNPVVERVRDEAGRLIWRATISSLMALVVASTALVGIAGSAATIEEEWLLWGGIAPIVGAALGARSGCRDGDPHPKFRTFAVVVIIGSVLSGIGAYVTYVAISATWSNRDILGSLVDPGSVVSLTASAMSPRGRGEWAPFPLGTFVEFHAVLAPTMMCLGLGQIWSESVPRKPDAQLTEAQRDADMSFEGKSFLAIIGVFFATILALTLVRAPSGQKARATQSTSKAR